MSNEVEVPFGAKPSETATLLLAAAVKKSLPVSVVRTVSEAVFMVPAEVADEAGFGKDGGSEKAAPAKKSTAKKTAKKSTTTQES